jgi:7-cyano-7-deazaguanine synthase
MILLSGGIDSTALLHLYKKSNVDISALFFNYGQPAAQKEKKAASAVSQHYGVHLDVINYSGVKEFNEGLILGRNAFLLHGALMQFSSNFGVIAMGIHSGTDYYDCSEDFYLKVRQLFEAYTDGCISFDAPFLKWTKGDIWHYCKLENVPVSLTYSCERGDVQPCGLCNTCKDLEVLFAS